MELEEQSIRPNTVVYNTLMSALEMLGTNKPAFKTDCVVMCCRCLGLFELILNFSHCFIHHLGMFFISPGELSKSKSVILCFSLLVRATLLEEGIAVAQISSLASVVGRSDGGLL